MAEQTQKTIEREYVIPLRREWLKVPRYKRTARSVRAIKAFIARHMRVPDRDTNKVKLDVHLNNEVWFRGCKKPPAKVHVRARKEGDIVRVDFVEAPQVVTFARARHEKRHKKAEKKTTPPAEEQKPQTEEKTDEEKKAESDKEQSVADANVKLAEQTARAQKHTVGKDKAPQVQRKALKK